MTHLSLGQNRGHRGRVVTLSLIGLDGNYQSTIGINVHWLGLLYHKAIIRRNIPFDFQ